MTETETVSSSGSEEDLSKYGGPVGLRTRWLKELDIVKNSKAQKNFERVGEKIIKQYKNQSGVESSGSVVPARVMFNVLWSNVQVLKPSLYSRMPKIVVERRFKDSDPVGRLAAQICERATSFMLSTQQDRFNYAVKSAVEDRLLVGRGQVWIRYDAEFEEKNDENGQPIVDETTGKAIRFPKPNTEKVMVDPLNWLDYFHSPARNPYEIRWQSKRVFMNRSELVKRWGDVGKSVSLDHDPSGRKSKMSQDEEQFLKQAEVFEIEDQESKARIWLTEGYEDGPLEFKPDVLKLNDFFSCPVPLLATTTTDSMYPTADFKIYEALAEELDYVTKRISSMVECIRFVGATAAQFNKDVKSMLKLNDGQLWPIEGWQNFAEKGGLKGVMDWLPFDMAVNAIAPLVQYQQTLLSQIFEITGIPDIVRGSSDPTETLGAQQQKAHWTVVKISEKQAEVQRFCREIISKVSEIIFEPGLFQDETIALMCGVSQMPPEDQQNYGPALQLLRDDRLRTFRVDIETDSTIAVDEDQDKAARMEYITAVNQLISNIQNVQSFRPELMSPIIESALFATRAFRTGRPLEGAWERAMQQIEDNDAAAAANPPQPPPDYEGQKVQIMQGELDLKREIETTKLQMEGQFKQADFEIKSQEVQIKGLEVQSKQQVDAMEAELNQFKVQFDQFVKTKSLELEGQTLELEKYRVVVSEKEKVIEEARLDAELRMKSMESAGAAKGGKGGGSVAINLHSAAPIDLAQIHPKRAKRRVTKAQKLPTGEWVSESVDVDDDEESKPVEVVS